MHLYAAGARPPALLMQDGAVLIWAEVDAADLSRSLSLCIYYACV